MPDATITARDIAIHPARIPIAALSLAAPDLEAEDEAELTEDNPEPEPEPDDEPEPDGAADEPDGVEPPVSGVLVDVLCVPLRYVSKLGQVMFVSA